jgi:FHS family L-fucose permease-like MFS transporter
MNQSIHNISSGQKLSILSTFGISFFIWGVITGLNFFLIEHLKSIFHLSYSISTLISLTFFSTYLLVSLPAGKLIGNWGYKLGLIIGLFTTGLGCMLFYFAIYLSNYYFFLLAMVVQATGITLLQVGANLYMLFFGSNRTAISRLTLMQGLNALGAFLAPIYGSQFVEGLFGLSPSSIAAGKFSMEQEILYVESPYILLSIIMYFLTVFFVFVDIPEFSTKNLEPLNKKLPTIRHTHVMHFKQLRLGAFAMFAYLGAEVALGNFLFNYANNTSKFYWGAALIGRIIGALILLKISPRKVLSWSAGISTLLLIISVIFSGDISIQCTILIGFFNAVMFPCIYGLALNGLGKFSEEGSAVMIMAFVGAGVIPFNAANFAAALGYKIGFIFPLLCYLYILFYSEEGSRFEKKENLENESAFTTS